MRANLAMDRVICGRYRILGVLGKGGMGTVFKAQDMALRRTVALKISTVRGAVGGEDDEPQRHERFLREASLSAQLAHPNIVNIYDYGHGEEGFDAFCYIAMELLQGETLGDRLRRVRTGLPIAEILPIATQVARGLRAAHQKGLVHRDLKPDNIMLTPGEDGEEVARILDFGLVKDITSGSGAGITDAGSIMGTPEYMAPEQVNGGRVDARTDLYSMGILFYELITGSPPFRGDSAYRIAAAQVDRPPPPMRVTADRAGPSAMLHELVTQLLEKRPEARVQTADELIRRLRELPEARSLRAQSAADALTLATASRYQTGRKLSETARAAVYEATHLEIGRQVAIKVYHSASPAELSRLRRELPSLALLRHASNARVLDVGVTSPKADGRPFLVMERVRGPTLRGLLSKHGALAWRRAVDITTAVLDGLHEAHTVGVLHRHLTPEHVLIPGADSRREGVKIIGYRVPEGETDRSGPMVLSLPDPGYAAPELLRGGPMNERSDLYAAGALLHECLVGHPPSTGAVEGHRSEGFHGSLHDAPADLVQIMRRAVSVDPAERFDSASELAAALLAVRAPEEGPSSPGGAESHARLSSHRRLRSTGQPVVWVLTDDPALRKSPMTDVVLGLRATMRVEEIVGDHSAALAARLSAEQELPPWVVVFGGMHVILEDPLLAALAQAPEVSRLLVSTHPNAELLAAAINFAGLDQLVTLPAPEEEVRAAIERMVARAGSSRRYYDDLRIVAQHARSLPGAAFSDQRLIARSS
jgi:eukaryotic-like serine/threonine-protein kinase